MNSNNYIGSSLFIVNLDFYYNSKIKNYDQMMIDKLNNNNDLESKNQISDLKSELRENKLAIVSDFSLPPIK